MSQAVQARSLHGSSRTARTQPSPMEPMEPIAEEKSELAMDIAQAVVEKLDIDRKLDEKMKELMFRGDRIFRDIQLKQEQSTEALCRSVGMCLESQRSFHEEHQRLLAAVKDLATMVIPFTPLGGQALEAQARASSIAEETEALRKQMEDQRLSAACAAAAAISSQQAMLAPLQQVAQSAAAVQPGAGTFSVTLRKADDVSLGLSVNADESSDKTLIVENVLPGGAVESWNRQCFGDATGERVVVAGDRIVRVNGIEADVKKMLEECTSSRLVKLVIARGPAGAHTRANATIGGSGQSGCETQAELPVSTLRKKAPEFVPSGADASPLQQTQQLAAPPGLFFPRPEDYAKKTPASTRSSDDRSAKIDAQNLVAGVISQGYGETLGMQDIGGNDDGSDKEN